MPLVRMLVPCALVVILMAIPTTAQESAAKEAAPLPTPEKVAAVVNGESIPEAEVVAVVERQLQGRKIPPETLQEVRQLVLKALINGRLVEQYLAEKKIAADPKEVDSAVQGIKKRVADAGLPFAEVLKLQGQTEESLRARIAAELAFQKFARTEVTDDKLQDHFAGHKEEFDGTEVQASHLLIKLEPDAGDEQKKAALARIKAIRQEIVEGLDFAEAAKKYSEGPSGPNGGALGFFPRHGRMVEPFASAAFTLQKGAVSEPVQTPFGLHLIQVTDRKPGDKKLDDVRDTLREVLNRDLWEKTVAQQRKGAKIEIRD